MYYLKNTITGATVVNLHLRPLYFNNYKDAYTFIHRRSLRETAYTIIQIGAIVSRGTIGRETK